MDSVTNSRNRNHAIQYHTANWKQWLADKRNAMASNPKVNELDEKTFELDAEISRREVSIKELEAKKGGITASQATVAGAVVALLSAVLGASITAWSTQNIEGGRSIASLKIEELKAK